MAISAEHKSKFAVLYNGDVSIEFEKFSSVAKNHIQNKKNILSMMPKL